MNIISVVDSFAIVVMLELVLQFWLKKRLTKREYSVEKIMSWKKILIRIVVPVAVTFLAVKYFNNISMWQYAVALSSLVWLMLLSSFTDFYNFKIPAEACWIVAGVNTTVGGIAYIVSIIQGKPNNASLASFAASVTSIVIITMFLAFITKGGFGSGDVRLLIAFSTLGWWTGYSTILVSIIIASLLQTVLMFTLAYKNHMKRNPMSYIPFAPALSVGYLIAIFWLVSETTACTNWANTLSC